MLQRQRTSRASTSRGPSLTDALNDDMLRKVYEHLDPRDYYALSRASKTLQNTSSRIYPATSRAFSDVFKRLYESVDALVDHRDILTNNNTVNRKNDLILIDLNIAKYKKSVRTDPVNIYKLALEYDNKAALLGRIFADDRNRSIPLYTESYRLEHVSKYISLELKKTYLAMLFLDKRIDRKYLSDIIQDLSCGLSDIRYGIDGVVKADNTLFVCFLYMQCYIFDKHDTNVYNSTDTMYNKLLFEYNNDPVVKGIFKIPNVRRYQPPKKDTKSYKKNRLTAYNACINYFLSNRTEIESNVIADLGDFTDIGSS